MGKDLAKEKSLFVVALFGAFLAFSSFKTDLSMIYITINNSQFSLLSLMVIFVVLLAISVYLFALDFVKYSFGKYQNFFGFKAIIPLANFFYSLAILFPIIIIFSWFLSISAIDNLTNKYRSAIIILT